MKNILLIYNSNIYAKIGAILLLFVITFSLFGSFFSTHDSYDQNSPELLSPSSKHFMGTDDLGRDIYVRVAEAARNSLFIGILSVLISLFAGIIIGSISGYFGGFIDSALMRLVDVFLAFPYVLGALALMVVLGSSKTNVIIAISVFLWTGFARLQRSSVINIKKNDYIYAAKLSGASNTYIIRRHILPNTIAPLIALFALSVQSAVMAESLLSFIHLGLQPPTPSLGTMLSEALPFIESAPWMMLFPGIILFIVVASFILFSEGLDDFFNLERKHAQR